MPRNQDWLTISDLSGGRNGIDPPLLLSDKQVTAAVNVDWFNAGLARRRGAMTTVDLTCATGGPFGGAYISWMHRHVGPLSAGAAPDDTAAQLWACDAQATPKLLYLPNSGGWVEVTVSDALTQADTYNMNATSFNGKLFICGNTGVDRLHVWDGSSLRRVGLAASAVPTVADTGAGAYPATIRYYKTAYTVQSGGVTIRRSELSSAVAFTPSGGGTAARVTKPTALSEGETHWELYGSPDGNLYYLLATTVVATTTYDDSAAPSAYSGTAPPSVGFNIVPTSWRYITSDDTRLLGAGGWESGAKNNRVYFTPVLGTSDIGDDERVPNTSTLKNYIDIGENDGGAITGLYATLGGLILVFKRRQTWKLTATGNAGTPYRATRLSRTIGCISHRTIVEAEDDNGAPALYWLSDKGPYRLTETGLEYLGRPIEDLWANVNTDGLSAGLYPSACYYGAKHQVWFGVSDTANPLLIYHTRSGGWSVYTHDILGAAASVSALCAFQSTVGASSVSGELKPYVAVGDGQAAHRGLRLAEGHDHGETFRAYITTKPYVISGIGQYGGVGQPILVGVPATGVTITLGMVRDFGLETRTSTALLTAAASESRVFRKCEAGDMAQATAVQFTLGDASKVDVTTWRLDAIALPLHAEGTR
jgi:hypothetical protein